MLVPVAGSKSLYDFFILITSCQNSIRIEAIEGTMIAIPWPAERSNPKPMQCLPVDCTRQDFEALTRSLAYCPVVVRRCEQYLNQFNLSFLSFSGDSIRRNAGLLKPQINPWNKKEIARTRLDDAGCRKEYFRDRVSNGADSQLVDSVMLSKALDNFERTSAFKI
jgi:hypothetical protein